MSPDSPPLAHQAGGPPEPGRDLPGRALPVVAGGVAVLVLAGVGLAWFGVPGGGAGPAPPPSAAASTAARPTGGAVEPAEAAATLLAERGRAVLSRDRAAFLAQLDPAQAGFQAEQATLFDRLGEVPLAEWAYEVAGTGPALTGPRAAELPEGAAIVRVRLTYRLAGTATATEREQFLTVVPRGGRWLLAGDTDAEPNGLRTQRDLWDLGPVRVVRGRSSVVVADTRDAGRREVARLVEEADQAVDDVDLVWDGDWSRQPVVVLPRSQQDMATLIGSDGEGLAQIAAVTTGSVDGGISRGDRVVINPAAFGTLGSVGRQVVLSHEMTHVATRASSVRPVPIWLSEGFADYVAYAATPVPTAIVASDVLDAVRGGEAPRTLPDDTDFDAGEGDIAGAYEGAWLACRMVAERYGEQRLVRLYEALSDSAGPGWPEETVDVLGVAERQLERQWRQYLVDLAG